MRTIALIVSIAITAVAGARNPDETLGALLTPNEGRPAVAAPGETIPVVAREPMALVLIDGDARINLNPTWTAIPGGLHRADCAIPSDCPPGIYAIEGATASQVDRTDHAVFIGDPVPDAYALAHIAAPHAGSNSLLPPIAADIAQSDVALIVATGDLTASGSPQDFRALLQFIRAQTIPVVLSPGSTDRPQFKNFFGPETFALRYGLDAYLTLGPDNIGAVDLSSTPARLHALRRETRSARWSVGLAPAYSFAWDMRTQIALFVDDPLDFLLLSQGETATPTGLPWGKGASLATPPAHEGSWRIIRVESYQPSLGEIRQVAADDATP